MEPLSECPVCAGRVAASGLSSHMATHPKQDILSALLRQQQPRPPRPSPPPQLQQQQQQPPIVVSKRSTMITSSSTQSMVNYVISTPESKPSVNQKGVMADGSSTSTSTLCPAPASGCAVSGLVAPSTSAAVNTILVPPMMGMVQVMSPCLIPQQNGPPIIVNVPGYFYPNVGMISSVLAAAGAASGNAVPTAGSSSFLPANGVPPAAVLAPLILPSHPVQPAPTCSRSPLAPADPEALPSSSSSSSSTKSPAATHRSGKMASSKGSRKPSTRKGHSSSCDPSRGLGHAPGRLEPPPHLSPRQTDDVPDGAASTSHGAVAYHLLPPDLIKDDPSAFSVAATCEAGSSKSNEAHLEADVTLQDLVAMETMEEAEDEERFFPSSARIEERLAKCLPHTDKTGLQSLCPDCGFSFESEAELRWHQSTSCLQDSKSNVRKSCKRSTATSLPLAHPTPAAPTHKSEQDQDTQQLTSAQPWGCSEVVLKSEQCSRQSSSDLPLDDWQQQKPQLELADPYSSQPALAASGQNHWKCNQCKVMFESGPLLWEHMQRVQSAAFKCTQCHTIVDTKKQLNTHRKECPAAAAAAAANAATAVSTQSASMDLQLRILAYKEMAPNEQGEFVCDKCDRSFKDKELLLKHLTCHEEEKPFECLECGKKFSKATLLRDHRKRHFEQGSFECSFCQKRFYTPIKLREHERVHTGEAPLACNICGKTFRRHSNLSEHKRIHEERPAKPSKEFFCHCGKVFKTQRDLDWHNEGEHENVPKKCTYCGDIFVHSSSLTRHIRLKHEADFLPADKKTSMYSKCPVCQLTFYKTSISKHIRIKHNGQKSFQCDICKASFVTKCNLINHQWLHKGVRARPFKCQLCRKAYLRKSLLDAHMRSHRGIKPFVCNECGLQFANKSNWRRHVSEHSGSRNFQCPECKKKFSRHYYLTDHLKVHTKIKPYSCHFCGKGAATRSNYNSHMQTHMPRESINSEV